MASRDADEVAVEDCVWEWDCARRGRWPTADEFEAACLLSNRPGIVRNAYQTSAERCVGVLDSASPSERGGDASNLTARLTTFFRERFDTTVPVVRQARTETDIDHSPTDDPNSSQAALVVHGEGDDECTDMKLAEYLDRFGGAEVVRQCLGVEFATAGAAASDECNGNGSVGGTLAAAVYLKDWHFVAEEAAAEGSRGSSQSDPAQMARLLYGGAPAFLGGADWLNELCDERASVRADEGVQSAANSAPSLGGGAGGDYRFVYVGGPGTWTPLHVDVYGTYSWSLNLVGTKHWYFARPSDSEAHWAAFLSLPGTRQCQMPRDIRTSGLRFERIVQRAGDVVFVPSMFLHQVHNPGPAISVNHNWACRHNAPRMVQALRCEYASIDALVDGDAKALLVRDGEWDSVRERMLMGSGGWCVRAMQRFLDAAKVRRPECQRTAHVVDTLTQELARV
jgi:hypothetical protein